MICEDKSLYDRKVATTDIKCDELKRPCRVVIALDGIFYSLHPANFIPVVCLIQPFTLSGKFVSSWPILNSEAPVCHPFSASNAYVTANTAPCIRSVFRCFRRDIGCAKDVLSCGTHGEDFKDLMSGTRTIFFSIQPGDILPQQFFKTSISN